MTTAVHHELHAGLREALDSVRISPDATSATVAGREIAAEDPRELRRLLSEGIYSVLHAGQREEKGTRPLRIRDEVFEAELAAATPHRTCRVPAGVVSIGGGPEGTLLVEREGVRVWVPVDSVEGERVPGQRVELRVSALRPALSPGFFLVHGSNRRAPSPDTLRVYVHVTDAGHSPGIWGLVLGYLEDNAVGYRAKALSARPLYPRRDAVVVYLGPESAGHAKGLAEAVAGHPGLGEPVSVFAERIGRGVATAWEPRDERPGMGGLSFGQHRASVLAGALLDAGKGRGERDALVASRFAEAGIDPACPARNT